MEYWHLLPVGAIIASAASLIGIGGGALWAPYLILVEDLDPRHAIMLSLLIQMVGMASATSAYIRKKVIYWQLAIRTLPFILVAMALGAFVSQRLASGDFLKVSIGFVCLLIAFLFANRRDRPGESLRDDRDYVPPLSFRAESGGYAIMSGMFAIGVAGFLIPVLRTRLRIPMQNAVATGILINFVLSLAGGILHISLAKAVPTELLLAFAYAAVGVFIGGQVGPMLSMRMNELRLKELFVFGLILIAVHMTYQSL